MLLVVVGTVRELLYCGEPFKYECFVLHCQRYSLKGYELIAHLFSDASMFTMINSIQSSSVVQLSNQTLLPQRLIKWPLHI